MQKTNRDDEDSSEDTVAEDALENVELVLNHSCVDLIENLQHSIQRP